MNHRRNICIPVLFVVGAIYCSCSLTPGHQRKLTIDALCKCENTIDVATFPYNASANLDSLSIDSLIRFIEIADPLVDSLRLCMKKEGLSEKNIKRIDSDVNLYKIEWCDKDFQHCIEGLFHVRQHLKYRLRKIHVI